MGTKRAGTFRVGSEGGLRKYTKEILIERAKGRTSTVEALEDMMVLFGVVV